jgi:hypothetical protein
MTTTALRIRLFRVTPRAAAGALLALVAIAWPQPAEAQLDPLLFLKRSVPSITTPSYRANVLVAVDTAPRMMYDADGHYYDPTEYARGNVWDAALGATTGARYRRLYQNLQWSSSGPQKFTTTKISTVSDASATAYANFYQKTRIGVARTALAQVITENDYSSRFGLLKMRHQGRRRPVEGRADDDDREQPQHRDLDGAARPARWRQPERGDPHHPVAAALVVVAAARRDGCLRRRRRGAGASARRPENRGLAPGDGGYALPQHRRDSDHRRRRGHRRTHTQRRQHRRDVPQRRQQPARADLRRRSGAAGGRCRRIAGDRLRQRWQVLRDHQGAD